MSIEAGPGRGWVTFPPSSPRWWWPRTRAGSRDAYLVYHPITRRARAGWWIARASSRTGLTSILPRGAAPPMSVQESLAPHVPAGGSVAILKANHVGRYVATLMDREGAALSVAKVATDSADAESLRREDQALRALGRTVPPPIRVPRPLLSESGLLIVESILWRFRTKSWVLPVEVAQIMGRFFRGGSSGTGSKTVGPTHGDFSPSNLLRVSGGWALIDWEDAYESGPAFADPFHYVTQAHALLGQPSLDEILLGLGGKLDLGRALVAYADAAEVDLEIAPQLYRGYLQMFQQRLDPSKPDEAAALLTRARILKAVEGL